MIDERQGRRPTRSDGRLGEGARRMHIDRRFLNWGVFFILLGAVPLAVQQNLVDLDVVARAWQLWPLLIIGAGIGLVLRRTSLRFVGGLIAAATFGLISGSVIAVGFDFTSIGASCGGSADRSFSTQVGSFGDQADLTIEFSCGDLVIQTNPSDSWTLSGSSSNGSGPRIDSGSDHLSVQGGGSTTGIFGFDSRQRWNLALPQAVTIDADLTLNAASGTLDLGGADLDRFDVTGNASSITMDFSTAALGRLDLQFNAGSAHVMLPDRSLSGAFQVNAGSITFCVPEGVGLRISSGDNITSSNNFGEAGLTKSGSTWQSANYGSAENRIDRSANANAGGFTLNPKGGCR
jgi:hypothetical protein